MGQKYQLFITSPPFFFFLTLQFDPNTSHFQEHSLCLGDGHAAQHSATLISMSEHSTKVGPLALPGHRVSDVDDNSLSVSWRHSYFSPEPVSNSSFCSYNSYLSHRSKRRFALALTYRSLHKYPSPTPSFSMLLWIALFFHANSSKTQPLVQLRVITFFTSKSANTLSPVLDHWCVLTRILLPVQWSKELNMQQNPSQAWQGNLCIQ